MATLKISFLALILDEVQREKDFFLQIKYEIDKRKYMECTSMVYLIKKYGAV